MTQAQNPRVCDSGNSEHRCEASSFVVAIVRQLVVFKFIEECPPALGIFLSEPAY
jgi:hypothetical protein